MQDSKQSLLAVSICCDYARFLAKGKNPMVSEWSNGLHTSQQSEETVALFHFTAVNPVWQAKPKEVI